MRFKQTRSQTDQSSLVDSDSGDHVSSGSGSDLSAFQSFLVITSSLAAEVVCGVIFIFNFYIPYFVSYVKIRGSKTDITLNDGKVFLLVLAASNGVSGYPLGILISGLPVNISLTLGAGTFLLGYWMILLGVQFEYGFAFAGAICLGVSSMMINISVLLRCLRSFRAHWGIVSGSLLGVSFGATTIFHIWEKVIVNPLNLNPVTLNSTDFRWYFPSQDVLDSCADTYWIMMGCIVILLVYVLVIYRIYPSPPPLDEEMVSFCTACKETVSKILSDVRFILTLIAFEFAGVAGLCARSSLKTYGETFIPDEHYLSDVGGSGALAGAVGAVSMGIILDITRSTQSTGTSQKLLLLNCLLAFTASVMMIFAAQEGRVWFLSCYDMLLFGFGGFSAVCAMVLYEIFGISKFPVAYGITSLTTCLSYLWYCISLFSGLPGKEFWLANSLFAFLAVVSAIGLLIQYHTSAVDPKEDEDSLTDDEEELDFIFHNGKKYILQKNRNM